MQVQGSPIPMVAILGSVRPGNYTTKALAVVEDEIGKFSDVELNIIDPAKIEVPLPGMGNGPSDLNLLKEKVSAEAGVILATPEYHGSYSSVIKLLIENRGFPNALSGKPGALLGVVAGRIGAIKAEEHPRRVCSHVGGIVLPGPISVAGVQQVFDEQGNCLDQGVEQEIRSLTGKLVDYIQHHHCPKVPLEEMVRQGCAVQWVLPTR